MIFKDSLQALAKFTKLIIKNLLNILYLLKLISQNPIKASWSKNFSKLYIKSDQN